MTYKFLKVSKIKEMLFNESQYIAEFCEAGIISLSEFNTNFGRHLPNRDMDKLRAAGHKIKPGAQMMGADIVVEEYEKAKQLLLNDADDQELQAAADTMDKICSAIKEELRTLAREQQ